MFTPPSTPVAPLRAPDPQRVLHDVNRYRRQHGFAPLRYSQTCAAAARRQAEYIAALGTATHRNPALPKAGDRLRAVGHVYAGDVPHWGENVFRYTLRRDPRHSPNWHVFHCYHISPHHDEQMLDPDATVFGTHSVVSAQGVLYNAEVFAN